MSQKRIFILGGGAAGFFAAIQAAEANPQAQVTILERSGQVLSKVKVSGGGRCNVTHACFDPRALTAFYPRGAKALLGAFHRFNPRHTVEWFEARGVRLKTEADGRMFPHTDDAQTIIDCLVRAAQQAGVQLRLHSGLAAISQGEADPFTLKTTQGASFAADAVLVATGSNHRIWQLLEGLGHTIIPPVPSLFTFNIRDARLEGLAGLSVPQAQVSVEGQKLKAEGAALITHWGLSGPAILRLSAWGARLLYQETYRFDLVVNWVNMGKEAVLEALYLFKQNHPKKQVNTQALFQLPLRLWERLGAAANLAGKKWADLSKQNLQDLAQQLCQASFKVTGKSTFKDEFVTCGGVDLDEVNFKTMESKCIEGLYFAGEVLDVDAITGGFNFQNAWTTGFLAGRAIAL